MEKLKSKLTQITNLKYLIIYLIVLVLPLSFVAICSYFIPSLNHLVFKTYYIYYGGISLGITSLIILFFNNLYLKTNFSENKKEVENSYIIKINLIFVIFHLIINIIASLLNYYNINDYFIFALYLFYPLIYFCIILFADYEKLSRKSVLKILISIYLLWYLLIPLISFILSNQNLVFKSVESIKSLLYLLLYNYLRFVLLVMPFMSLALNKVSHENKEKSLVHKFNFSIKKLAIIAVILALLGISILVLINR